MVIAALALPLILQAQTPDFSGTDSLWRKTLTGSEYYRVNDSVNRDSSVRSIYSRLRNSIHGRAEVEYQYHEGNYLGQNIPKHLFRYSIQPEVLIGGVPLRFNIGYASDYRGQIGSLYQFNVKFDPAKYKQLLFERGQKELNSRWGQCDSLMDILNLRIDSFPSLDTLDFQLTKLDSFLNLDSLGLGIDTSVNLDSLQHIKAELLSKKEELSKLLSLLDKLNQYRILLSQKRSELARLQSRKSKFGIGTDKWREKVKLESFQVGSYSVSSGKYFAQSGQLFGVSTELGWSAIRLHVFGGQTIQPGNFLRNDDRGKSSTFRFIGTGIKIGGERNFIQSYYTVGRSKRADGFGESDFIVFPDRNSVFSTQAQMGITKFLSIYSEMNYSQSQRYDSPAIESTEKLNPTGNSTLLEKSAVLFGARLDNQKADFNMDLSVSQIGDGYFSYLNPYIRKDVRQIELKLNKSLLHSKLRWAATGSISEDNVGGTKSATTRMERITNTLVLNPRKGPVITFSNSLIGVKTRVLEMSNSRNSLISVSALNLSKVWIIQKWKSSYSSTLTWLNTATYSAGNQVYGMNSLVKAEAIQFEKIRVAASFRANRIRDVWSEIAQETGIAANITKRAVIAGDYCFQRNLMYTNTRDLFRLKGIYFFSKSFNVEGRMEYHSFRESKQSLIIGSIKLQFVW
ncbi:MAG: hypothetical protein EP332_04685 [Bacteroidetes bacterium]|nr:MAG: hypothetical protein EP332_04685 [Bacteroidota bacterium]